MPDKNKKTWTRPQITSFADADDVWDCYKCRGSPEELARLRKMLEFASAGAARSEAKRRRA